MKPPSDRLLRWVLGAALALCGAFAPVFAQDEDIPPPPEESAAPAGAPAAVSAPVEATPTPEPRRERMATPTPAPPPKFDDRESAQRWETDRLKVRKKGLEEGARDLDKEQFALWEKVQGVVQYPSVSVHGVGRMFGLGTRFQGAYGPGLTMLNPNLYRGKAFLDLEPMGSVDKPVRWSALLRFTSNLLTGAAQDGMEMLKGTLELHPDFMSATLGDFYESYTPFTLFNRDSLDLKFAPELTSRWNEHLKYEGFLDQEPSFPFRGVRLGTQLLWPDPKFLQRFGVSLFAHMVRNGYNDTGDGTTFFGPYQFTDWIFAGKMDLRTKAWDLGGLSVEATLGAHGVMLDQILGTDSPGSPYDPNNLVTWARQYLVGTLDPGVRVRFGGDLSMGGSAALAVSRFQDDKMDGTRVVEDYAVLGGPYVQWGASKVTFNLLDVGPSYFAPLAQMRQDHLTVLAPDFGWLQSPGYFQPTLRGQELFSSVGRPSFFLTFYDRTLDNVFPYGLATPNRRGYGVELEVKALEKKALKLLGSAYRVQEMNGNLVVNIPQIGYIAVEDPTGTVTPKREFVHVNVGPSLNLGPLMGWDRDLEFGGNVRYEETWGPSVGLKSLWTVLAMRIEVLPFLQISGSRGERTVTGTEWGHSGTQWARTPYLFDNTDLGSYSVVDMGGKVEDYTLSLLFTLDLNSRLALDFSLAYGDLHPFQPSLPSGGLHNEFMGLSYEIEF